MAIRKTAITLKRIELICDIPEGVTYEDINQFLLFKFHGHARSSEVLDKFKGDELNVNHFRVEEG